MQCVAPEAEFREVGKHLERRVRKILPDVRSLATDTCRSLAWLAPQRNPAPMAEARFLTRQKSYMTDSIPI